MNTIRRPTQQPVALITGAGGGIGQAAAQAFADAGYALAVHDIDTATLDPVLTALAEHPVMALSGDVRDPQVCAHLIEATRENYGRLDVLINNAGIMRRGNALSTSDEDWALTMQVNVDAVFRLSRAAVSVMQTQERDAQQLRGAIINVASCWGVNPGPDHVAYCVSKAAVASLTQCMARDHAGDGIRINAVCPNEVDTPMLRTGFAIRGLDPQTALAQLDDTVPLGRVGQPDDIADAMVFLASDKACYICGALLEINGAKPVG